MASGESERSTRGGQGEQQERRGEITIRLGGLLGLEGAGETPAAPEGMPSRLRDPKTVGREIQKVLLQLPGAGYERVVLDFEGLATVDSATLGAVLLLRQSLAEEGCRLALRGCSEPLRTTMGVLRLDGLFSPGGGRAAG